MRGFQEYPMQWCERCKGERPHSTNGKCMAMHRTTRLRSVPKLSLVEARSVAKEADHLPDPLTALPKVRRRHDQAKVRAAVAALLAGEVTLQQAARDVGCDTDYLHGRAWKAAKDAVKERDNNRCQYPLAHNQAPYGCIMPNLDVHHRITKGTGGSSNPLVAYYLPNLITLCRTHHTYVTDNPTQGMSLGLVIPRGMVNDPSHVPVKTIHGLVMLTPDGGRQPIDPPGDAA